VTPASPTLDDLRSGLRRVHRGTLATLAVCALVITGQADPANDAGIGRTDRSYTLLAVVLGVASIAARRQAAAPTTRPQRRLRFAIGALVLAGAIGLLGVALALQRDEREAALLFTLGGALLALRASPTLVWPAAMGSRP